MSLAALSIPASYARLILDLCAARGVDLGPSAKRFDRRALDDPKARLPLLDVGALLYQAHQRDDAIGYEIGLNTQLTSHGFVGYGVLTYPTLGEALDFGMRYAALRTPFVTMRTQIIDSEVRVNIEEAFALGAARRVCLEHFLIGIWRVAQLLAQASGLEQLHCSLHFDYPEPACHSRYQNRLPPCHFDAAANQLRFPASHLKLTLATADATAARLATELCENERQRNRGSHPTLTARVRAILADSTAPPSLLTVAAQIHLSPRSLKRRLRAEGGSYQALVDEHREKLARRRLGDPAISVAAIAEELGYTTTANFTRAFRRWTGMTPSRARALMR